MIPAQLGLMQFALASALGRHGRLAPGDVVLVNHPYHGGTHTPDLQLFAPAYDGRSLVGYTGSIAHHIDVGGRFPGTESAQCTELYQEGLLFPPVKLVEAGRPNTCPLRPHRGQRPRSGRDARGSRCPDRRLPPRLGAHRGAL